jgi:hypothetical protein
MGTPVTTLDPRFSDENAVATSWDETRMVLDAAELWWLTTGCNHWDSGLDVVVEVRLHEAQVLTGPVSVSRAGTGALAL